jgi:hypothetical protein
VVERDRASEGLFAGGDERMEKLIEFRELLCGALECGSLLPLSARELARGPLRAR